MKIVSPVITLVAALSVSVVLGGCASYRHGWEMKPYKVSGGLDLPNVAEYADRLESMAVTRDQMEDLTESFEAMLAAEPGNRQVLIRAAKTWIAMAVVHARDLQEEGEFLRRSIMLSERAMMTSPAFAARINSLAPDARSVAAAADALGEDCGCAMGTWALASLLYFEDCLSEVLKITNEEMVLDVIAVLERHAQVAPEGMKPMSKALRGVAAAVRPKARMVNVAADFEAAVAAAPESIVIRWLGAKFLYGNFGDKVSLAAANEAIRAVDVNSARGFKPLNRAIRLSIEKTR